jgi:hypothetical protein
MQKNLLRKVKKLNFLPEDQISFLKNIIEKCLLPYQFGAMDLVERGLTKIVVTEETVDGSTAQLVFDNKKEAS